MIGSKSAVNSLYMVCRLLTDILSKNKRYEHPEMYRS